MIPNENEVDVTPSDIAKALQRPPDFGYFGDEDDGMFETWSLGAVIEHRDSGLLGQANAKALIRHLESIPEIADDWRITECNHWAVGWVRHLSFRVADEDGSSSRVFKILTAWWKMLEDYPVADDNLYSELEMEATYKWLSEEGPRVAKRHGYDLSDGWCGQVMDWWDANMSEVLESRDDQGACPRDTEWLAAFKGCGFAKVPEDE